MVGAYTVSEILVLLVTLIYFLIQIKPIFKLKIKQMASGCGSYIVSGYLKRMVIKYKRESLIIQVLLIVILFGLIILPINTLKNILDNPNDSI